MSIVLLPFLDTAVWHYLHNTAQTYIFRLNHKLIVRKHTRTLPAVRSMTAYLLVKTLASWHHAPYVEGVPLVVYLWDAAAIQSSYLDYVNRYSAF